MASSLRRLARAVVVRLSPGVRGPGVLLLTNTASSGALMGLGDMVMQRIEAQGEGDSQGHDWARTGQCTAVHVCQTNVHG